MAAKLLKRLALGWEKRSKPLRLLLQTTKIMVIMMASVHTESNNAGTLFEVLDVSSLVNEYNDCPKKGSTPGNKIYAAICSILHGKSYSNPMDSSAASAQIDSAGGSKFGLSRQILLTATNHQVKAQDIAIEVTA